MNKQIRASLVWAGLMLSLAFAARWAEGRGYISADTTRRVVAMNGLWIAYYGNLIPKKVAPNGCLKQVQRFAGWSLVLGGLIYTSAWIFAPIPLAVTIGTSAVLSSVIASMGYCFWRTSRSRKTPKFGG